MDLAKFLLEYPADPADSGLQLHEWHSEANDFVRCVHYTSPWWADPSERAPANGRLVIRCTGVVESEIRLGYRASYVDDLEVLSEHPLLWQYGQHAKIFGNAPLPDADRFFLDFTELVESELHLFGRAASYLGARFSDWRRRVTEHAMYQLLEGPAPLMVACQSLLDRQNAVYRLLVGDEHPGPPLSLVVIGESFVICEGATVEVTPEPRHPV